MAPDRDEEVVRIAETFGEVARTLLADHDTETTLDTNEATGVSSILSLRLFAEENTMGSLNLYATRPHAFGTTDVALAAVFATHAAVAMSSAHREELLERKAATRDLIGRAKGILMASEHVTDHEAFDLLRRSSQHQNIKLTEVAEQVNLTGEPPARPTTT